MHKNPCKTVHLNFFICSPFVNPVDCRLFINISKDIWHKKTQTHRTARNHFLADDHKRSSNWLHFCDIGDRKVEYIIGKKKKKKKNKYIRAAQAEGAHSLSALLQGLVRLPALLSDGGSVQSMYKTGLWATRAHLLVGL